MKRKEIAALLLIGALLSGVLTAGANEAGTAANPLISLQWLQETFLPKVEKDLENKVDNDLEQILSGFLNTGPEGCQMRVKRGDVITLESGSVLTPLAGGFSIVSAHGTVLDVTAGKEFPSDAEPLVTAHRYLTAEASQALFTVTSDTAVVHLSGLYRLAPSLEPDYNMLADALHDMKLFLGSDTTYGSGYDLELAPTRIQGLIIFLRLLGEEDAALSFTDTSVTFVDVPKWARPYVAYAFKMGYTNGQGIGENGEVSFGPNDVITPRDFMTFLLRAMKYQEGTDFKWKTAVADAHTLNLLTSGEVELLTDKPFLRAQVVYLAYFMLSSKTADGILLSEQLAATGAITEAAIAEIMGKVTVTRL